MTSTFGCPHCGRSNPIDARFCAFCGTHLSEVETSQLAQLQEEEEEIDETAPATPHPATEPEEGDDKPPAAPAPPELSGLHRPSLEPNIPSQQSPPSQAPQLPAAEPDLTTLTSAPSAGSPEFFDLAAWLERFPQIAPSEKPALLDDEMRRQVRQLFVAEVPLTDVPPLVERSVHGAGLWRQTLIYWSLLAVLIFALIFRDEAPEVLPHAWPGVDQAYTVIESLPDGATVLVDWAYDPATAGEMDLITEPVVGHLLEQNINLVVVSQLPLGPATARRLIAAAGVVTLGEAAVRQLDLSLVDGGFLPGGAATLPLLGQAPTLGVPFDLQGRAAPNLPPLSSLQEEAPALMLVVADRFEPVQRWLEQVQPLNNVPVVAITSAAAGPAVRPYLDSGQLVGLVSGYNGSPGYQELILRPLNRAQQLALWRQVTGHNWALVLLLLVILAGNLATSWRRRAP